MVISGKLRDFPTLYESDRSLVKLILNGGVGVFSDTNPWFGNPENFAPSSYQPKGTITWGEFYLEPGLAGIVKYYWSGEFSCVYLWWRFLCGIWDSSTGHFPYRLKVLR